MSNDVVSYLTRNFSVEASRPDYEHWARMEFWTPIEMAALAADLEPEMVVFYLNSKKFPSQPTSESFRKKLKVLQRGVKAGALSEQTSPREALLWLRQKEIFVSAELTRQVAAKSRSVDWEAECSNQREMFLEEIARLKAQLGEQKVMVAPDPGNDNVTDDINPKRQTSFYKVISIMSVGMGYDHRKKRSPVHAEIVSMGDLMGIHIAGDTVRAILSESARNCPPHEDYFD